MSPDLAEARAELERRRLANNALAEQFAVAMRRANELEAIASAALAAGLAECEWLRAYIAARERGQWPTPSTSEIVRGILEAEGPAVVEARAQGATRERGLILAHARAEFPYSAAYVGHLLSAIEAGEHLPIGERPPPTCRRCTECVGENHHWMAGMAFVCKHCPALVAVCERCEGPDEPGHVCLDDLSDEDRASVEESQRMVAELRRDAASEPKDGAS